MTLSQGPSLLLLQSLQYSAQIRVCCALSALHVNITTAHLHLTTTASVTMDLRETELSAQVSDGYYCSRCKAVVSRSGISE